MSDQLREKRVELILQQLEDVPALPASAAGVVNVAASNAADVADAVTALVADEPFAQCVLKLLTACGEQVDSIDQCLTRRGFDTLRLAAVSVGAYHAFAQQNDPNRSFDYDDYWKHAVAVGCAAQLLAEQMVGMWGKDSQVDPFECFVSGLLHDIGKL